MRSFVGGEAVGGISVRPGDDVERLSCEIGYWLGEPYWGRGIVTRAVAAVTEHAFETLQLVRVEAEVFEGNMGSMRVLEKCGYEREARMRKAVVKRGVVMDAFLYARVRE